MLTPQTSALLGCFFLTFSVCADTAQLPETPNLAAYSLQNKALSGTPSGQLGACLTDAKVFSPQQKKSTAARTTQQISNQQIIQTGPQSRCVIILKNGDTFTLGNNTLVQLMQTNQPASIHFWHGSMIFDIKKKHQWHVLLTQGTAELSGGKFAIKSRHELEVDIVAYRSQAVWRSAKKRHTIRKNSVLRIRSDAIDEIALTAKLQRKINNRLSPEVPFLSLALALFKNKKFAAAKTKLQQLQNTYPNNSEAAYYLGAIYLQDKNNKKTLQQWRKYVKLDPKGAEKKQVLQKITVINDEEEKKQIKDLLANQDVYSKEPPQPGTIAIIPFDNNGDKQYNTMIKGLTAMVITDLSKVPGLKVLEREKIQKFIDEIKLSQSGLVDAATKIKAGRILRAERVIEGAFQIKK